ncbi:MAG: hypothetical protein ABIU11_07770 [Chitinophagaceae bacterium]
MHFVFHTSMTYKQFTGLDEINQELILWSKGVHIADHSKNEYRYLLYQVDGFYVEVEYNIEFDIINQFKSFETTDLLDPYLKQIRVNFYLY